MRWRAGVSAAAVVAMVATTSPAAALWSPTTVAVPHASPIPLGTYPGSIDLGGIANDLVFSTDGTRAYATTAAGVTVLRTADWSTIDHIEVGGRAYGASLLDDGTRLAIAVHDGDVVEVDLASGEVVASHEVDTPLDVAATATGDLLVSTTGFLGSTKLIDRSVDPAVITPPDGYHFVSGAISRDPSRSSLFLVGHGATSATVHRIDAAVPGAPIVASSAPLGRLPSRARLVPDPVHDRLYTPWGDIFDPVDLTEAGSIPAGLPVVAGEEIVIVTADEITVLDRSTLDPVRGWAPACAAYPEGLVDHDAQLSPDGLFLVLPSATGLCLEPLDGSGPHPAELVFRTATEDGGWIKSGTLLVLTPFGDVVVELDIDRWDHRVMVPEGEYFVALVGALSPTGWPLVPVTPSGHAVLERDAEMTRIEGLTIVDVTTRPYPFDIVDTSQTFWSSIQWLVATGITRGCGPVAFCPDDYVTRGQMAAFIDRALDLPDAGPAGFTDDAGTFQQNIWNLKAAGITTGCAHDRYCTDDYVTRAQMAAFLDRALQDIWPFV